MKSVNKKKCDNVWSPYLVMVVTDKLSYFESDVYENLFSLQGKYSLNWMRFLFYYMSWLTVEDSVMKDHQNYLTRLQALIVLSSQQVMFVIMACFVLFSRRILYLCDCNHQNYFIRLQAECQSSSFGGFIWHCIPLSIKTYSKIWKKLLG